MDKNNLELRVVSASEKTLIKQVAALHVKTFEGFFLSFMGKGFLTQMYESYCFHEKSGLIVAMREDALVGFLAYSENISNLYKFMIRNKLIQFAWYSIGAFFRKPTVFMRLVRAFLKPGESNREEPYIQLSSIGVSPLSMSKGVGSLLIDYLKELVAESGAEYISLETDAVDNESVNHFYIKNDFVLARTFCTHEGRQMNEYHWKIEPEAALR